MGVHSHTRASFPSRSWENAALELGARLRMEAKDACPSGCLVSNSQTISNSRYLRDSGGGPVARGSTKGTLPAYSQPSEVRTETCMGGWRNWFAQVVHLNCQTEESCLVAWGHRYQVRFPLLLLPLGPGMPIKYVQQ